MVFKKIRPRRCFQNQKSPRRHPGTRPRARPLASGRRAEGGSAQHATTTSAAACTCARIGADSPAARAVSPIMLRAGARNPDAGECPVASTSDVRPQPDHEPDTVDVQQLYAMLNEYLQLEHKFQPRLCLPVEAENGEVTTGARDGAAHVLRCLKMWYDLPADVLIYAVNLFDRFLTKMKVRPCHIPCITVSCMNIAIEEYARHNKQARKVSIEELVSVSSSSCTAGDVSRMSRVIADKLGLSGSGAVLAPHWLRLFRGLVVAARDQWGLIDVPLCQESELMNMLEIVVCDAACANARASELALVLLYHKLELQLVEWSVRAEGDSGPPVPEEAYRLFDIAAHLQAHCHMSDASLVATRSRVRSVLARYEARAGAPHRQRLVWRLSERTLKVLRPTDRLTSLLPTIEEQQYAAEVTTSPRNRSGSESSESETSDWPCSPVLPVYCDN